MKLLGKILFLCLILAAIFAQAGCIACIPQYVAPPIGSVSACYPEGHDPFLPVDRNPTVLSPWDWLASLMTPFLYGPPR